VLSATRVSNLASALFTPLTFVKNAAPNVIARLPTRTREARRFSNTQAAERWVGAIIRVQPADRNVDRGGRPEGCAKNAGVSGLHTGERSD
jgi:hypothetical protein